MTTFFGRINVYITAQRMFINTLNPVRSKKKPNCDLDRYTKIEWPDIQISLYSTGIELQMQCTGGGLTCTIECK
jgi:hypothetical protein